MPGTRAGCDKTSAFTPESLIGRDRRNRPAEFAWLGALSRASGGVMGSAFATLLLSVAFRKLAPAWDARVLAGAVLLGILTAVGAGWMASARMVRRKPFDILRDE